mmetsp:Transcript_67773/g.189799  ORF Transcript_67773/g.189799 Transcript_67773/m.189799 type:complete len:313 (-) Transcript_67773:2-940(-)
MRAACPWVKQPSSNHCVKKGNTVQAAVPGAPCARMSTKVGYLKSCHTFGKFLRNTEMKPCSFRREAKCAAFGSPTRTIMATPTKELKATTAMMLTLHPARAPIFVAAYFVATRPKSVLQIAPTKNMEPKALPRFDGGFLSATRLNNNGCTRPRPTPFSTRPTNIIWKFTALAQSARPAAQNNMPNPTSWGLGNISPTKPHGKAKSAATHPFAVASELSSVCDTWKRIWNSLKNKGSNCASTVHATLQRHMTTNSSHCLLTERWSSYPSSGSIAEASAVKSTFATRSASTASAGIAECGTSVGAWKDMAALRS